MTYTVEAAPTIRRQQARSRSESTGSLNTGLRTRDSIGDNGTCTVPASGLQVCNGRRHALQHWELRRHRIQDDCQVVLHAGQLRRGCGKPR